VKGVSKVHYSNPLATAPAAVLMGKQGTVYACPWLRLLSFTACLPYGLPALRPACLPAVTRCGISSLVSWCQTQTSDQRCRQVAGMHPLALCACLPAFCLPACLPSACLPACLRTLLRANHPLSSSAAIMIAAAQRAVCSQPKQAHGAHGPSPTLPACLSTCLC